MQPSHNRHFISVSEYLSRNILENYPQLANKITLAHPGIGARTINKDDDQRQKHQFRDQYQIPQSAFVLLFVAHGFKRKGLPAIIAALESLNHSDIHLVVVGSGNPDEINMTSPTIKQNVHFIGVVKDMSTPYLAADALIHPTLGDTYGMVVLEAMSYKLPVIVSSATYCGFSEHLTQGEALMLEDPRNVEQIKTQINQLYHQSELRESLSLLGLQKSQHINWDKTLDQTLHAYQLINK